MSIDGPIILLLPEDIALEIANRFQELRLAKNLSRKTVSEQSGVPAPSLRLFETTGKISLVSLLKLADALGSIDDFSTLFRRRETVSLDEFMKPPRKRGTR